MVLQNISTEERTDLMKRIENIIKKEEKLPTENKKLVDEKKEIMKIINEKRTHYISYPSPREEIESIVFEIVNLMNRKEDIKYRYKEQSVTMSIEEECIADKLEEHNISMNDVLEGKISFAFLLSLNRLCNLKQI